MVVGAMAPYGLPDGVQGVTPWSKRSVFTTRADIDHEDVIVNQIKYLSPSPLACRMLQASSHMRVWFASWANWVGRVSTRNPGILQLTRILSQPFDG